jgi:hypothetical protein
VLRESCRVRCAIGGEPDLEELPIPFVPTGPEDAAILAVVGEEEPVLKPLPPAVPHGTAIRNSARVRRSRSVRKPRREAIGNELVNRCRPPFLEAVVEEDWPVPLEEGRIGSGSSTGGRRDRGENCGDCRYVDPRTARSAASNPIFECVLSQKGFVSEPPQRHSTTDSPFGTSYSLPSASISRIGPVTL